MKSSKRKFLFVVALLVAGAVVVGWWWLRGSAPDGTDGPATARAVRRDFSSTVLATGSVRPQIGAEVKVGARISGRVEKLHVNVGDRVKKEQVLASLEKNELEAQVDLRQADLSEFEARLAAIRTQRPRQIARAEASVEDTKAVLQLAQVNWQRTKDLRQKDVATIHELDTARMELNTATARLELVKADLTLANLRMPDDIRIAEAQSASRKARLDEAMARLAYATIRAPISGTVASVATQEGETVAASLSAPTFVTIIDLTRLQVDAFVDEVDIGRIKVAQKAAFTVDAFPDREFEGRVIAIYPKAIIQENVVNYDVVIDITSPYENLLRPEMTTNVTIFLEARRDVLTVPARAIQRQQGKSVIYVQTPGGVQARQVKVGWRQGQWVEVLDGLSDGQIVLLEPPQDAGQTENRP